VIKQCPLKPPAPSGLQVLRLHTLGLTCGRSGRGQAGTGDTPLASVPRSEVLLRGNGVAQGLGKREVVKGAPGSWAEPGSLPLLGQDPALLGNSRMLLAVTGDQGKSV
jgi:hypothetical protein